MVRATGCVVASLLLIHISTGCKHQAPQLYPEAPPALDPPTLTEFQPTPGDCPESKPMDPGTSTDCGGVLVPTHQAYELLQVADVAFVWSTERLAIERQARLSDREAGQASYAALWEHSRASEHEVTALRIAVPVVAVLCVVVGATVGVAAAEVSP